MKKIIYILLLFFTVILSADTNLLKFQLSDEILTSQKNSFYLAIDVSLNESGYIYANPKGPGTGKDTQITVNINSRIIDAIFISKPIKYYPESSPEWINIYRNSFQIYIPVNYEDLKDQNSISVNIDALFCTDESCTPVKSVRNFILKKSSHDSKNITNILPDKLLKIKPLAVSSDQRSDYSINLEFHPVELKTNNIHGLLSAILFGLLAGLLLNFMPCVLPVISIKILSFIKNSNQDNRILKKTSVSFSAGIMTSFIILSSIISFFKMNWGEIFQNSLFLSAMIYIMFIMAMSIMGTFQFSAPNILIKKKNTANIYSEAFFHGFIATLLATPCSGPFLGATLAWTLSQPLIILYAVFISIGTGMSLPYLIVSFNPGLLKYIPKPGNWMIIFEKIIGLLIIAAILYFLSLLNPAKLILILWALFFIYIACLLYGKYQNNSNFKSKLALLFLISVIITAFFLPQQIGRKYEEKSDNSIKFSSQLLTDMEENKIYLLKFTADWCINCKVIDKTLYDTKKFHNLISKNNITVIEADLSENNPELENFLKKLGSRSIPFAAVFTKETFSTPVILRDIYSINDIINAVNETEKMKSNFNIMELSF